MPIARAFTIAAWVQLIIAVCVTIVWQGREVEVVSIAIASAVAAVAAAATGLDGTEHLQGLLKRLKLRLRGYQFGF